MKICNVVKAKNGLEALGDLSNIVAIERLDTFNIKMNNSIIVSFDEIDIEIYKKYSPKIFQNFTAVKKQNKQLINDIYISIIDLKAEHIVILNSELGINSKIMKKLFKKLKNINVTIILISQRCLAVNHKNFIKKYFYCSEWNCWEKLRTEVKKTYSKNNNNDKHKTKVGTIKFGKLTRYETKNKETKKFYESILNTNIGVVNVGVKNRLENSIISFNNPTKLNPEYSYVIPNFSTRELKGIINEKNEVTFIYSDTESLTIETNLFLSSLITQIIIDKTNWKLIYLLVDLYYRYGEDFIHYQDIEEISELEKKELEKGLDEQILKSHIALQKNKKEEEIE